MILFFFFLFFHFQVVTSWILIYTCCAFFSHTGKFNSVFIFKQICGICAVFSCVKTTLSHKLHSNL